MSKTIDLVDETSVIYNKNVTTISVVDVAW